MQGTEQKKKTMGVITKVYKCWWMKINTKAVRKNAFDGAEFPYIIKVRYAVDGKVYNRRKFIMPKQLCPKADDNIGIWYDKSKPKKCYLSL